MSNYVRLSVFVSVFDMYGIIDSSRQGERELTSIRVLLSPHSNNVEMRVQNKAKLGDCSHMC